MLIHSSSNLDNIKSQYQNVSNKISQSKSQNEKGNSNAVSDSVVLSSNSKPSMEYVPGELLVRFKGKAPDNLTLKHGISAEIIKKFDLPDQMLTRSSGDLCQIKLNGISVEEALAIAGSNSNIAYAEPNYIISVPQDQPNQNNESNANVFSPSVKTPNDLKEELWGLKNEGQLGGKPGADIDAEMAWNITTGDKKNGPLIAVIDTGVDIKHPDLINNIFTNTAEIPGDGIDNDGNGFIDDVHGYNFHDMNNDPTDNHSHGTHCAGTIGAEGNNGEGITGVAWNANILPLKFMDKSGGTTAAAIEAVIYATKMGADICSNSWGGGGFSQALHDAIAAYPGLFICAAGNNSENNDLGPHYPSNYDLPNVISVASTDQNDQLSSFSNYGKQTVDIAAPGSKIYSTTPNGQYAFKSGTSMATPHVSGVAALIMSAYPELPVSDVKAAILEGGVELPELKDKVATGKRLDAYKALVIAGEKAQQLKSHK